MIEGAAPDPIPIAKWIGHQDRNVAEYVALMEALQCALSLKAQDHQTYLADGGYGFLLGDGALNYGRESIVESYYTAHVWRGIYVAPGLAAHQQSRLQP